MSLLITPFTNSSKHPEPFEKEKITTTKRQGSRAKLTCLAYKKVMSLSNDTKKDTLDLEMSCYQSYCYKKFEIY